MSELRVCEFCKCKTNAKIRRCCESGNQQDDTRKQIGGDHYTKMAVQPWDVMRACFSPEEFAGFLKGNVVKYIMRSRSKGGIEDLRKAQHYLEELVRLSEEMKGGK